MMTRYASIAHLALGMAIAAALSGCVTNTVQEIRESATGMDATDSIVVLGRRGRPQTSETELDFVACVSKNIGSGSGKLNVIEEAEFVDALFPWFEPRTAPAETKNLAKLMDRPGVAERIAEQNVRYIIWLDGDTERVAGGGSLSCAAGPGGGGCFGFAWWQNDADYDASVWDLHGLESAGTVSADVSGTSFMPALVVPLPFIARTQAKACRSLADQLHSFIVQDESV